uniref:Tetratricopeptide repeat protein n=1 Tax=Curvibacter symbiont subsp. Hydra magnipapillata TaxID=667019 RepID=C9YAS8_CURXX|nr:hypothetical protein Csp_A12290 [Curvibacter putative symbiont of Hydra magnipapillata]
MKHAPTKVFTAIRWIALAATLSFGVAHADDYSDVAQLVRNGKLPEAMTKVDQFLVAKPRDPQMRFLKGVIQRDSGKTSEAIATFTRLTEDYPELPEPYNNLAVLTRARVSTTRHARPWKWLSAPTPATPLPMKTWVTCTPSWPAKPTAKHCN